MTDDDQMGAQRVCKSCDTVAQSVIDKRHVAHLGGLGELVRSTSSCRCSNNSCCTISCRTSCQVVMNVGLHVIKNRSTCNDVTLCGVTTRGPAGSVSGSFSRNTD